MLQFSAPAVKAQQPGMIPLLGRMLGYEFLGQVIKEIASFHLDISNPFLNGDGSVPLRGQRGAVIIDGCGKLHSIEPKFTEFFSVRQCVFCLTAPNNDNIMYKI